MRYLSSKKVGLLFFTLFSMPALLFSTAHAASISGGPVTISATVPGGLTLELRIVDQLSGAEVPSLDFGELVRIGGEVRAAKFFKVFLKANAAGDPFTLTQIGTPLTRNGGSETIPSGAYFVKPSYAPEDNAQTAQPIGSVVGSIGTAVGTRALYTDPTGSSRIITLVYTLSGDSNTGATEIIPLSQKSGAYSGTVQFTLTTA